jgi:hypothetical protein
VVLGSGRRLFEGVSGPVTLELAQTRPAGQALIEIYARV